MSEEKFEEILFLKTDSAHGEFSPLLFEIKNGKLILSARVKGGQNPDPCSLAFIQRVDDFLHKTRTHFPSEKCENPERIVIF